MTDRAPGFYWVRLDAQWTVGEYDPSGDSFAATHPEEPWMVIGSECAVAESALAEIGPRVESPEELRRNEQIMAIDWSNAEAAERVMRRQAAALQRVTEERDQVLETLESLRLLPEVRRVLQR